MSRRKQTIEREVAIANAVFTAGEIGGTAARLNIRVLQEFLDLNDPEFKYKAVCEKAIEVAKIVQGVK